MIENLPEDLRDYVRFAATCGIRKGELRAFRWDMLQGSTLHVPASICKNRKGRTLPLVGEMLAVVEPRSFLIIKDGTEDGKPLRMYLCAPDPDIPPRLWSWSCQLELAGVFEWRVDASKILKAKVRTPRGCRIVKA